jgi:cerevisin
MKDFLLLSSVLPLLAAATPVLVDSIHNNAAPILSSSNADEIPDSYMVIFKKHVTEKAAVAHHSWVQDTHSSRESNKLELRKRSQTPMSDDTVFEGLKHTYNIPGGLLGYSGHFDEGVIELVRRHPDVSLTLFHRFLSADKAF